MKKLPFWIYLFKSPGGYMSHELGVLISLALLYVVSTALGFAFIPFAYVFAGAVSYFFINIIGPRVSNNTIYGRLQHQLHMSIRGIWRYWKIDYLKYRTEIEELLKKEFIEAFQRLSTTIKPKKFKVRTHGWVYHNVIQSPEVQKIYHVKIIGGGHDANPKLKKVIAPTILSLMSWPYIIKHWAELQEYATQERTLYILELTPRKPVAL